MLRSLDCATQPQRLVSPPSRVREHSVPLPGDRQAPRGAAEAQARSARRPVAALARGRAARAPGRAGCSGPGTLVFPFAVGTPLDPETLRRTFPRALMEEIGTPG